MRAGFRARLFAGLLVTLVAVGAVQYFFLADDQENQVALDERMVVRADAMALARFYTATTPGEVPLNAVNRYLRSIAARPGNDSAKLVDGNGTTIASGKALGVGALEKDPHVRATLRRGSTYSGRARDYARGSDGHLLYSAPVNLPRGRHALVVTQRRQIVDDRVADLQRTLMLILLGGVALAVPTFYLVGGRSLVRLHRAALERATRDGLTDLGNHRAFQEELERAVALAQRHGDELALAVFDLDDFKFENDRYGHSHGDRLLGNAAAVLGQGRTEDRAFRIGGDEFALLLPRTSKHAARLVVNRRMAALEEAASITVSCGVAVLGPETDDAESLREQADAAVYEAKRRGGGCNVSFAEIEGESQVVTIAKVRELRRLLEEGRLGAVYQPIWDLARGAPFAYEALARPNDAYGLNGPGEAFEVAGAIGRSPDLDELCYQAILKGAKDLPKDTLLFMNVAPQTLDHGRLAGDTLVRIVRAAGLEPERIVIEITEQYGGRTDRIVREARRLRGLGFKLALDDVGAGNSGLEMLRQLEVDFVKVDRAVIVGALEDAGSRAVLVAIMAFAHQTGSYVIAEGIEDVEMLELVRDPSVGGVVRPAAQGVQGYYLGRPAALNETLEAPLEKA